MTQQATDAVRHEVDHDYAMGFTPGYFLLRDLSRIITEKPEGEQFGLSFGADDFCQLWDRSVREDIPAYRLYYSQEYPHATYYFWDGQAVQKMEHALFFNRLTRLFSDEKEGTL